MKTNKFQLLFTLIILLYSGATLFSQSFTVTKKKIGITGEAYGLGMDNFGVLDSSGKEILDIKNIKYGNQVTIAFYNISGFEVVEGLTHLRMTMSIINLTDNTIIVPSQTLLNEKIAPETLKNDYLYSYLTISKDFVKGKNYLLKLHLYDVNNGFYADLVWKFKANFK